MNRTLSLIALALACAPAAAQQQSTHYEYDALGRMTARTDGLGQRSTWTLDAFGRVITQTNPMSEATDFAYDGGDALVGVHAANGALTTYEVDGLGNVNQELSPDRGTLTYTYDAAGNAVLVRDARGAQTETSFDALNRPLTRAFRNPAGVIESTHSYVWDTAPNGMGRLASLDTGDVALDYAYDTAGRVATKTQTVGSSFLSVRYEYDPGTGHLLGIQYPSGRYLDLTYDAAGRVADLTWDNSPIASNVTWHPFGGVESFMLSNGLVHLREQDTAGRLSAFSLGGQFVDVGYDAAGRVTGFSHEFAQERDQAFDYDAADRLTGYQDFVRAINYTYDANGNRLDQIVGAGGTSYSYAPGSNRLTQIGAAPVLSDAAGNRTADGARNYTYDASGRMVAAGTTQYQYNGLGERVVKTAVVAEQDDKCRANPEPPRGSKPVTPPASKGGQGQGWAWGHECASQNHPHPNPPFERSATRSSSTTDAIALSGSTFTQYVYDEDGKLLGEYDASGQPLREYAWLGLIPVAMLDYPSSGGFPELYAIETDHLGTPRLITDSMQNVRWRWYSLPFGDSVPEENPQGYGRLVFNLRFPGQYYDQESGLHYNYFRDYDPKTGRYMQSDPIGLSGSINTYLYAEGNPQNLIDLLGLKAEPGDSAFFSPQLYCTCADNCKKRDAPPQIQQWCVMAPGISVKGSEISLSPACESIFKNIYCDKKCADFCSGKPNCENPFPD